MTRRGCPVRDDGHAGPCALFYDEHRLVEGELVHPVLAATGYWTYDEARP